MPGSGGLSRKRERGANKRAIKTRRLARVNAGERSDALRARAADLIQGARAAQPKASHRQRS
ncbi:protein of unknown function (plasmid) [Cupriavidus taiwanensis]|uniref:Uncharacterized protein n=1 Tax=Cupriavidus taiwanensis TaxID=164546 RepID=A0A7Z7JD03_9BURK|nr:protein of unknown function [Cupriavidus taiwanensis]SOZ12213.1 protein of unknown function [Cupriavidus taiwanensis]SOZ43518.1 protein of unknown function [Cupriavidus taiwanensis]SPC22760.1 protein of unknown function [Cupriavidus taiwanensis]SPD54270.1 protein of unknown function [Cupriavidus taiwanensis]